jgi:hypothetical protein
MARHKILGKRFTGFQLSGCFAGADDFQIALFKFINDSERERRFAADKG